MRRGALCTFVQIYAAAFSHFSMDGSLAYLTDAAGKKWESTRDWLNICRKRLFGKPSTPAGLDIRYGLQLILSPFFSINVLIQKNLPDTFTHLHKIPIAGPLFPTASANERKSEIHPKTALKNGSPHREENFSCFIIKQPFIL